MAQLTEYRLHFLSHQLAGGQPLNMVGAMIQLNEQLLTAVTRYKTSPPPPTLHYLEQEITQSVRTPLADLQGYLQQLIQALGHHRQVLMIVQPIAKMTRLASLLADHSLLKLTPAVSSQTAVLLRPLLGAAHAFDKTMAVKLLSDKELGGALVDGAVFRQALSYFCWALATNTQPNRIKINGMREQHHIHLTLVNPAVSLSIETISRYRKHLGGSGLMDELKMDSVEFALLIATRLLEREQIAVAITPSFPTLIKMVIPCT